MTRRLTLVVGSASGDAGETLVELIVAVAVLGIAVVALVSGLGTAILTSGLHRTAAVQSTAIRDYAEALEQAPYVNCATLATTFAGNLTILGSVANVIVVESARRHVEVSFWDYARFGIPVTVLTTIVGMSMLLLLR